MNLFKIDCSFPFQYQDEWYDTCTNLDSDIFWCSIDTIYQGRFAECKMKCPELARVLVQLDIGYNHSSCTTANPNATRLTPNETEIDIILNLHNTARSQVLPTPANMPQLIWNFGLSRVAQSWSDNCIFEHDCNDCRNLLNNQTIVVGQNAFEQIGGNYGSSFWTTVFNAWYNEKEYFVYGEGSTTGNWEDIGHYSQIINDGVYEIGCGATQCGDQFFAFCNYAWGQYSVTIPYTSGVKCSGCDPNLCTPDGLCSCNKICQNYGVLNPSNCTCECQPYTTGDLCEVLLCNKTDADYGCWGPGDPMYCMYSNTVEQCPNTCNICSITLV